MRPVVDGVSFYGSADTEMIEMSSIDDILVFQDRVAAWDNADEVGTMYVGHGGRYL